MDNLIKEQVDTMNTSEISNKRKRHCSFTQSDESPRKKVSATTSIIHIGVTEENNGDATHNINADSNDVASPKDDELKIEAAEEELYETKSLLGGLCDEVLYEIFKFLDTWSLMTLMNVCKRFQKFILDKRLWEDIDLSQEPLPLGILEDMLERSHNKTRSVKLRGPSPSQHIEGEIQHFNQTIHSSLTIRCTKLITLELYGITLDSNQITFKDFPQTLKRLVLKNCNVRVSSKKSLFTGIDTILINLEELAIENNSWFDPYYIMPLSKLPALRYLSLRGCWQMQEFIPYGSIAARHGFKQLEILDLRDTPLNDSDLQCFNTVETLKEIYLQCPEDDNNVQAPSCSRITQSQTVNNSNLDSIQNYTNNSESDKPSTSSVSVQATNISAENTAESSETIILASTEGPSTSSSVGNTSVPCESLSTSSSCMTGTNKDDSTKANEDASSAPLTLNFNDSELSSSSTSSSSSSSSHSPKSNVNIDNNTINTIPTSSSSGFGLSPNIVPLVGTNAPSRSRFLPRPDHIFYLDVRNRSSPNAMQLNIRDYNNIRHLRLHGRGQMNQHLPAPIIEQMMRHNVFWDIVNPLGRVVSAGGPDRSYGEENGSEYHLNLFSLSSPDRIQSRGTISDRGVCCFGRTRQPVQHGVIWIRFNNRPSENRFERFSVRDYKFVTDISLQHLVQCSPHLIFLDVSGTSVTLEGLQRFKELKPECKVVAEHLLSVTKGETIVS